MSDLKMQIAFANILRKKTEPGVVAPAVPRVDARRSASAAASEQPEAVKRELAKRSAGPPRSVGTIRT